MSQSNLCGFEDISFKGKGASQTFFLPFPLSEKWQWLGQPWKPCWGWQSHSTSPELSFLGCYVREKPNSILSGASLSQQLSFSLKEYNCLHGCPVHLLPFWTQGTARAFTIMVLMHPFSYLVTCQLALNWHLFPPFPTVWVPDLVPCALLCSDSPARALIRGQVNAAGKTWLAMLIYRHCYSNTDRHSGYQITE